MNPHILDRIDRSPMTTKQAIIAIHAMNSEADLKSNHWFALGLNWSQLEDFNIARADSRARAFEKLKARYPLADPGREYEMNWR